jgi:NitT/TauT family transport system substrate-binding protein
MTRQCLGVRANGAIAVLRLLAIRKRHFTGLLLIVFAVAALVAGRPAAKKVTLMPLWTPQAQFAGYYIALDKGMYSRRGIDLDILPAGPGRSPAASLENGTADFALLWLTTALRHRADGHAVVNVAQIIQTSSMMLVAKKASGIRTIPDMNGKKVGLWDGDLSIPPRALFAKSHVNVREVRQSRTVNLFLRGGIDVASAMWYNEYHTIIDSGHDPDELSVFFLHDHGMDFPEDGLYTLEKTLADDPAKVNAFVFASLEGWRYAFAHPDEAIDVVIRRMVEAHLPANRMHQRWMLDRMRDLALPGGREDLLGVLDEPAYRAVAQTLLRERVITSHPDYRDFARRADAGQ